MQRENPMELNFEGLQMQKWNIPMDRAWRGDQNNGAVCLFIMVIPRVMVIKMPKMAHFLYFLLRRAKNLPQFRQNIQVQLKYLIEFI